MGTNEKCTVTVKKKIELLGQIFLELFAFESGKFFGIPCVCFDFSVNDDKVESVCFGL